MDPQSFQEKEEEEFLKAIAGSNSIKFLSFTPPPEWFNKIRRRQVPIYKVAQIAYMSMTKLEVVAWIKGILSAQKIKGKYLFSAANLPFALVFIEESYDWIETLWYKPGFPHVLEFLSLETKYWLEIGWTESCLENNCYVAYSNRKPEILLD